MRPLHHPGGDTAEDASLVQRFIDSEGGTILGTFLHTFGALLFTAGIALYLYQSRLVSAARSRHDEPSLHLLPYAHGFNLSGIALNGLGGVMRLYQSDHPGLSELGTSAWVQLLLVKHLFLIIGVGLAVFLTYRTHILSLRDEAPKLFLGETRRITTFAWTSFVTILAASVLGAVATTQLAPMTQAMDGAPDRDGGGAGSFGIASFQYENDTGVITGSVLMPGRETSEIAVRENASQLFLELTWLNPQASTLDLQLRGPDGKEVAGQKTSAPGRIVLEVEGLIVQGTWRADVVSTQALNERYHLLARLTVGVPPNATILEETYTVNPKAVGASRFVEINLNMKNDKSFDYSWEVIDSSENLDFNIHLHVAGKVEYPVQGSWNRKEGSYTHNSTADGVSLMWENPHTTPLRVHFRIIGDFTVDSKVVR